MQPKVGSLNTNRWDKSRAFQSIQWKTNSWNLEPRKTKGRTVVLFGGSSNFLFFSLFLISLLFFARKASFTRILSLDLKVSLIVPFLPSGLKDLQSVTLGNSLQSFPHITRKLTIVRLLVSNRSFGYKYPQSLSVDLKVSFTRFVNSLSFVYSLVPSLRSVTTFLHYVQSLRPSLTSFVQSIPFGYKYPHSHSE